MPARLTFEVSLSETWLGVPPGLQAVIAIEAAFAMDRQSREGLGLELDRLTNAPLCCRSIIPSPQLVEYAMQLSASRLVDVPFTGEVELLPPSRVLTRWRLAAGSAGQPLEAWMLAGLTRAPRQAVRWEAAAAYQGLTLTEWVLLQALSA
jgi:hypothetical protein